MVEHVVNNEDVGRNVHAAGVNNELGLPKEEPAVCYAQQDYSNVADDTASFWNTSNADQVIYPLWCFGFNEKIPVINLSKESKNSVLYASAHLLIVADFDGKRQRILRGHCNQISCLTSSGDKRWLASGDAGSNSAVILWDSKTGEAVRIMLEPHKNGVTSIALTEDARYLATLSADEVGQQFCIWNWTSGNESPLCTITLDEDRGSQNMINFKSGNYFHVVTNSMKKVNFYHWDTTGNIEASLPSLDDEDFNKRIGSFVGSQFIPNTDSVITATTQGLVVVWEKQDVVAKVDDEQPSTVPGMKAIKLVTLHDKPITFITITRCYIIDYAIVTGDASGVVKFFDTKFMLVFWLQNLSAGPIASVSFANRGIFDECSTNAWRNSCLFETKDYPQCSTIPGEKFVTEDFVVTTQHSSMLSVDLDDDSRIKILLRDNHETVTAVTAHPTMPLLTTCSLTGRLITFNYLEKTVICMKEYGNPIQSCKYSPSGVSIAIGFTTGVLSIVDPISLENITTQPFTYGRGPITHVDFCPLEEFCAYSDAAFTTTLLRARKQEEEEPWEYVGRIRAHYRPISDIRFWLNPGKKTARLFTLGEDQIFTEYDLRKSEKDKIVILTRFRVEQTSVPLCIGKPPDFYKEDFILLSTGAAKFKLLHSTNYTVRKTVMTAPQGSQYRRVVPLPNDGSLSEQFIVCLSRERLALVMLPLDGDPLKTTNIIAHPSGERDCGDATSLVVSYDGKYVFTAGGPDTCVHMWGLNPEILATRVKNAGDAKRRFYELLSPELLEELKDYYYYSMLKVQGMECFDTRRTALTIPTSEIPFIMRAIGYYPTEEEIENMKTEIKYSKFSETGLYMDDLDLDTFIQMYCNYRPYQGTLFAELEEAFENLCHVKDCDTGRSLYFRDPRLPRPENIHIPPEFLMSQLQTLGEPLTERELTEYLAIILGHYPEGANLESKESMDKQNIAKAVDTCLPMFFNAKNFAQRMLGLRLCRTDDEGDYYAAKPTASDVGNCPVHSVNSAFEEVDGGTQTE